MRHCRMQSFVCLPLVPHNTHGVCGLTTIVCIRNTHGERFHCETRSTRGRQVPLHLDILLSYSPYDPRRTRDLESDGASLCLGSLPRVFSGIEPSDKIIIIYNYITVC